MRAILTDITKCIGCAECVSACKITNKLGKDKPRTWQSNDGLSAENWTSVLSNGKHYVRKQCRHCKEPACASVCPVGALHKTEDGAVVYDKEKCLGCRYCMMACPYSIPKYDWDEAVPYVQKCIMCYQNIKDKNISEPACTAACPEKATIFGERDDLIREAQSRINLGKEKYEKNIYGENEVGGTNVLYLVPKGADIHFLNYFQNQSKNNNNYGMPDKNTAIPETTKLAMQSVPFAFLGMGAVMSSLYWLNKRKNKISLTEISKEKENGQD